MIKGKRSLERIRAERVAHVLETLGQQQPAEGERIIVEDQSLLDLADRLHTQSPFAPDASEQVQLRKRFDQRFAAKQSVSRASVLFRFLHPALRWALWIALLIGFFSITSVLIANLLEKPTNLVAGPAPTAQALTATTPMQPTATAAPFPALSQTVNGIRVELRDVETLNSSLRATFCYQPPDQMNRRLEGVDLQVDENVLPFYPASSARRPPGADGMVCETFTAANPVVSPDAKWTITVRRLVGPRQTTPDCAQLEAQIKRDIPGIDITMQCKAGEPVTGYSLGTGSNILHANAVRWLVRTYMESDVKSGPWVFLLDAGRLVSMIAAGAPLSPVVVPDACDTSSGLLAEPQFTAALDALPQPTGIVGGGTLQSGKFTVLMGLACDPVFSRQKDTSDEHSEINGLGIVYIMRYTGDPTSDGVEHFSGVWPFVLHGGGGGSLRTGDFITAYEGLLFPETVQPDFTRSDVRLRYVARVRMPDGTIEGAALTFTLQRTSAGYRPVDVRVESLTSEERQKAQMNAEPTGPLPFPTLPVQITPVPTDTQALLALLEGWQRPLLASPGWVHLRTRTEMPNGNDLYAGLKEYTSDDWFQIDAQAQVITSIHIDRRMDGTPLQQVIGQNGKSINLTFGQTGDFQSYPLDLTYAVNDTLKRGDAFKRMDTTINGQQAILITLPGEITRRDAVDAASGAWLYTETVKLQSGDDTLTGGSLDSRTTLETAERVDAPPADVLTLLGRGFAGYTPPAPYGTPAPNGFDPSASRLILHSVQGDSFNGPSFWYGDISAADASGGTYLLGRVNFGSVPDGYCERSADGSKLAFNYFKTDPTGMVNSASLRWFDLRALDQIYQPAPELVNLGVLTWSPKKEALAVFGCKAKQVECGLYQLDPSVNQIRLLLSGVFSLWQPIWNPDGSQLAFVDTLKEGNTLYVVDMPTGSVIYQSKFDAEAWQVPPDSPTTGWGVTFPRGRQGSSCFEIK